MTIETVSTARSFKRVNLLQRAESALLLGLSVYTFQRLFPHQWLVFWLLFFIPDISLLGYAGSALSKKRAADLYNSFHSYVVPVPLLIAGWALSWSLTTKMALILAAHISFDRMLGYGLKLQDGFCFTHLGMVGMTKRPA